MVNFEKEFVWNDQMYMEDDEHTAWFIGGDMNALFKLDRKTGEYTYVKGFPDFDLDNFRINSICFRYSDSIFCFPDNGNDIWILSLTDGEWSRIKVNNSAGGRIGVMKVCLFKERMFAVSIGMKQILEIDPQSRSIVQYHSIFDDSITTKMAWECIEVNNCIYCITQNSNRMCEFDLDTKTIAYYEIPEIKTGICTICFDGLDFWFSGYAPEIYVWNKKNNETKVIIGFPRDFKVFKQESLESMQDEETVFYESKPFLSSRILKDKIWFIPFQANKILYIDKKERKINVFEIEEENDDKMWLRPMNHKYIVEYTMKDRCIALYSFKNKTIFEIDVNDLSIRYIKYKLKLSDQERIWKCWLKSEHSVRREFSSKCLSMFLEACESLEIKKEEDSPNVVGKAIYMNLKNHI